MRVVRAGAVQMSSVLYSREGTVDKVVQKIHELGHKGVQFATFPETVVPYYPYFSFVQTPLQVLTAPHSPWQNPFAERLIGSIRRECLNHILVLSEPHLRRILTAYFAYDHRARTHLSLHKDAPDVRPVEPPEAGRVGALPEVGGLHHRYVRQAA
jgi:predicted amidohydrolase